MKKLIYFSLFLLAGITNAQDIVFADSNFKLKLLASDVSNNTAKTLDGSNIKIDANNNGEITVLEASLVYELSIPNEGSITSLDGIQFFANLTVLDAQKCAISGSVNLSNLRLLELVFLNDNQITAIDFSGCIAAKEINCNHNLIQKIDVSSSIVLQNLKIEDNQIFQIYAKNGKDESIDLNGALNNINYICADESQVQDLQDKAPVGCLVNSSCTSTPGGNFNTISGTLYFDATGNGFDASDLPHPYVKLRSVLGNDDSTNVQTVTKADGTFSFATTETGGFDVLASVENPTWFSVAAAAGSFIDKNNNVFNQNFLLTPVGVHFDVEAMIRPISQVVAGSDISYEIVFKNKGNQLHSGQVTFTYNQSVFNFVSSTLPLVNSGTGTLSLGYSNLLPFEVRSFKVTLKLNNAVATGSLLPFSIAIDPNGEDLATQIDNTFNYFQKVIATNPNRMECIEGNIVSISKIGKFLHYAVNFENTGLYEAKNVIVKTFFNSAQFDDNSFQILNASHPLQLEWMNQNGQSSVKKQNNKANNANKIAATTQSQTFTFRNAGIRRPGGQGGILLKIKTEDTITNDTKLDVNAAIYFDYDVIQTAPTTSVTAIEETTFQNLSLSQNNVDVSITVYPNPTTSLLNIASANTIKAIELFDIYGRLLQSNLQENSTAKVDLSERAVGIYFVKITSEKGSKVEKIVRK